MIPRGCVADEDLTLANTWAAADPRRAHVHACARCSALRLEFESVAAEGPAPAVDAKHAKLFEEAVRRGLDLAAESLPGRPGVTPPPRPAAAFWRSRQGLSALAFGTAAALVVGTMLMRGAGNGGPGRERGSAGRALEVFAARIDGRTVELRWRARRGTGTYRVELMSPDFTTKLRRETGADTVLVLHFPEAAPGLAGTKVWWKVTADSAGVALSESAPESMKLP